MLRDSLKGIVAVVTVARMGSFTRAAAALGVSQPALSQTVRAFEERLGVRLLARTTRSVVPTTAGERLLRAASPCLAEIDAGLSALARDRAEPAGNIRIAAGGHAARTVLLPMLGELLSRLPTIRIEIVGDRPAGDRTGQTFDAAIRLGTAAAGNADALRVGPDVRMAFVAAPTYLAQHRLPVDPCDLQHHRCILDEAWVGEGSWSFENEGRHVEVPASGFLVGHDAALAMIAALDGHGIALVAMDDARPHIDGGRLVVVLDDWRLPVSGYHLHLPHGRPFSPALAILVGLIAGADHDRQGADR